MNRETTILTANINTVAASSFEDGGYSLGVSACYAGCVDNYLVMAGGCNFPSPGNKKYYDSIYIADVNQSNLEWKLAGHLPMSSAYGLSISNGDSLVFIGGNNNEDNLSLVYSVHINKDTHKAKINMLPSMPCSLDNAAGTLCDGKIYVVGGNMDGKPSNVILSLDLNDLVWKKEAEMPGKPRVQPVCVSYNGNIYIWGGFHADNQNSCVATDGLCYNIKKRTFSTLHAPVDTNHENVTLSGGTAVLMQLDKTCQKPFILATGGVNKDIFLDAISGRYELVERENYLKQDIEWYKFNGNLFAYDIHAQKWMSLNSQNYSKLSRAGAAFVNVKGKLYYIGGELKPSVRTPEIISVTIK